MKTMKDLWSDPTERDTLVSGIRRWLSKTGDLSQYSEELSALASILNPDEVCELYALLASERLEFEWRGEFTKFFPASQKYLPAMQVTEDEFERALHAGQIAPVDAADAESQLLAQRTEASTRWSRFWKRKGKE